MVNFNLYRNPFGNVSYIFSNNISFSFDTFANLIDIFKPKYMVTKILALNREDAFFNLVSDERYSVIFPEIDTITSETIIISKTNDLVSVFSSLIKSEPRCISLYEIKLDDSSDELFINTDEFLIKSELIDYSISMIIEESCLKITFNSNHFKSKPLLRLLKEHFH